MYETTIRVNNNWTVLQFIDIKVGGKQACSYLKTCQRYLGLEFSIKDFPSNGIVFDFFIGKQILKKFVNKISRKVILCRNSQIYTIENTEQGVIVRLNLGDCYEFSHKDYLIFESTEINDNVISRQLLGYVHSKFQKHQVNATCLYGKIFVKNEKNRVLSSPLELGSS